MEDDLELGAIRERRLAETQVTSFDNGSRDEIERKNAQAKQEEMRMSILTRILSSEARERLSRISLVKPNLGRELEDALINQARLGQLRGSSINGQVSERDLTNLLEKISSQELAKREASKVQFQRRGFGSLFDDDDDY